MSELLQRAAMFRRRITTSQEQLQDVAEEPGSVWMDNRCRRYSLRHLAYAVVRYDRSIAAMTE